MPDGRGAGIERRGIDWIDAGLSVCRGTLDSGFVVAGERLLDHAVDDPVLPGASCGEEQGRGAPGGAAGRPSFAECCASLLLGGLLSDWRLALSAPAGFRNPRRRSP